MNPVYENTGFVIDGKFESGFVIDSTFNSGLTDDTFDSIDSGSGRSERKSRLDGNRSRGKEKSRTVIQGQFVEPTVCFSDL